MKFQAVFLVLAGFFLISQAPADPSALSANVPDVAEASSGDTMKEASGMSVAQSVVLGVVEGVTEYLPVSSTGHLILTQRAMGMANSDAANAYAICIQGGAILAVLILYYKRIHQMLSGFVGRDPRGLRLAINTIIALLPAVVLGLAFEKVIKSYLFGLWPIVGAWFVGGAAILIVARYRRGKEAGGSQNCKALLDLNWRMALVIGLAQCIAMCPGVSRSLVTIVAGVLVGLTLPAAVEFSFLLGVATLGGATLKDAMDYGSVMVDSYGMGPIVIGFIFAFVSAVLAIKWMVAYLNRHGLSLFGYYRIGIAVVVAILILASVLDAGM